MRKNVIHLPAMGTLFACNTPVARAIVIQYSAIPCQCGRKNIFQFWAWGGCRPSPTSWSGKGGVAYPPEQNKQQTSALAEVCCRRSEGDAGMARNTGVHYTCSELWGLVVTAIASGSPWFLQGIKESRNQGMQRSGERTDNMLTCAVLKEKTTSLPRLGFPWRLQEWPLRHLL